MYDQLPCNYTKLEVCVYMHVRIKWQECHLNYNMHVKEWVWHQKYATSTVCACACVCVCVCVHVCVYACVQATINFMCI